MSELSTRLRLRREELGLSQEELAQRMGYRSKSSITKLEKGINDIPQSKVEELAAALHLSRAGAYNLMNAPDFPTLKIGGRKLVMKQDLIAYLHRHTNRGGNPGQEP